MAGAGSLKLIHEKYKGKNAAECIADLEDDMQDALDKIKDLKTHLSKASEDLSALTVSQRLVLVTGCSYCLHELVSLLIARCTDAVLLVLLLLILHRIVRVHIDALQYCNGWYMILRRLMLL